MLLEACLNGQRLPSEHPALPVTPSQLAVAAGAAVEAGARAIHAHPKGADGRDTLAPDVVAAVVAALRAAVPGVPIGLTTGAWASSDPAARLDVIRRWRTLPDFASVNWGEDGSVQLAERLLDLGVAVEAGIWTPMDTEAWRGWPRRLECLRLMLEVNDAALSPADAVAAARELVESVGAEPGVPVLLHGLGRGAWAVLAEAAGQGLDTRIGLEDALVLPDGRPATDNAELVEAALAVIADSVSAREAGSGA